MRVYSKAKDPKKPTKPKVARSPRPAAKPLTPPERAVSAHVAETFGALGAAVHDSKVQAALGAGQINTATDRFPWGVFDQKINAIAGPLEEIVRRSLVIPHLMPKSVVIQTNFNHLDPRVALAARTQASKLAASMAKEQYAKVRTIIGNGVAKGDTSRQIGRQLRAHIGLNARQDRQMATARLDATQAAIDAGLSGDALDASVQSATDSLWTKMINYRADMIARTETMAAQNQGLMLGIQQSYEDPQSSVDNTYLKRWIATDDERTCETCGAVDGDEVPLDENFVLDDGTEIGYPLEDGSSPHPNCRCTVGLVPPDRSIGDLIGQDAQDQVDTGEGDAGQMAMDFASSLAPSQDIIDMALRMFAKDFNPDQERDEHGRWTSDGGDFTEHTVPQAQAQALESYANAGYIMTNAYLRDPSFKEGLIQEAHDQGKSVDAKTGPFEDQITQIDRLIASSPPLTSELTTYRGITSGEFADQLRTLQPGDTFTDKGFVSTSQEGHFAASWSQGGGDGEGMLMQITVPAGAHGIDVPSFSTRSRAEEEEFLLPRDLAFTVTGAEDGFIKVRVGR